MIFYQTELLECNKFFILTVNNSDKNPIKKSIPRKLHNFNNDIIFVFDNLSNNLRY